MIAVPFRPPLPAATLVRFLGDRAIPGVEEVAGPAYRRWVATPSGPELFSARLTGDRVDVADPGHGDLARAVFDLGADPAAVVRVLGGDPVLGPVARRNRGVRVPGVVDGFELLVRAVLGQQVSVRAARTMLGRVAERFGSPAPGDAPGIGLVFPAADRLADAPLEQLGITRRRAATIRRVAELTASGGLDLGRDSDPDEATGRLLELDGIGPWTADYVRMRAFGDRDVFPSGDLGVRRAAELLGLDPAARALLARAEAWRPWRAYAAMLLWGELAPKPVSPAGV
ncbi:MAG TPA: AlkA N-terminal domain-containing protein [Actinomycetota bacterium]|nr:AlkA N-terminal domain-containing protein [Actinomycetota bacterium]